MLVGLCLLGVDWVVVEDVCCMGLFFFSIMGNIHLGRVYLFDPCLLGLVRQWFGVVSWCVLCVWCSILVMLGLCFVGMVTVVLLGIFSLGWRGVMRCY